jgi:hypothetical protein
LKIFACGLVALGTFTACSSSSDSGSGTCTQVPIFNSSFAGYHSWSSDSFEGAAIASSPHTSGPRREYINEKPAHGSTSFPVGTIIVKEIGAPPASQDSVFAMVKVGCDYNSQGAVNWEWFELQVDTQNNASILWSGSAPPPGMTYGGTQSSCNDCHVEAKSNDYVQSMALQLGNF